MAERMKATSWYPERIEKRPEMVFHHFVGGWRSAVAGYEEEALRVLLPCRSIIPENDQQRIWNRQDGFTGFAFGGLDFPIPSGPSDVEERAVEVNVIPLQPECFSGPQPLHCQNAKECSPGLLGDREDFV